MKQNFHIRLFEKNKHILRYSYRRKRIYKYTDKLFEQNRTQTIISSMRIFSISKEPQLFPKKKDVSIYSINNILMI
jgi:hypothetical protein